MLLHFCTTLSTLAYKAHPQQRDALMQRAIYFLLRIIEIIEPKLVLCLNVKLSLMRAMMHATCTDKYCWSERECYTLKYNLDGVGSPSSLRKRMALILPTCNRVLMIHSARA